MPRARQGDIWWAGLPPPAGRRPVLILTRSDALLHLVSVTVAPLTRTIRHVPSEVVLSPEHGVPSACAVSLDNIVTVRKDILDRRIVQLSDDVMAEVFAAIRYAFRME